MPENATNNLLLNIQNNNEITMLFTVEPEVVFGVVIAYIFHHLSQQLHIIRN